MPLCVTIGLMLTIAGATSYPASPSPQPVSGHVKPQNVHSGPNARVGHHPAPAVEGIVNGRIADPKFYSEVSAYHQTHYGTAVNPAYALHPSEHHGYWHQYWANQPWIRYNGHYGFWLALGATAVFVAETSPGICAYWNGYAWVPYWNPPHTPYHCPY
jgi:hypothetical protein